MIALAGSGGSITSFMEEPGNQSLLKLWRQQVTRITVVNRFARKYRAKSLQYGIAPGLTAASPQLISEVKDLIEKSNTSEGSTARNLSTGALFSPKAPIPDAPKQKFKLGTSKKKNGGGFSFKTGDVFKDHCALSTIQIVLISLTFKILEEADLLDEADLLGLFIVTVIALDSRQEGTTPTYNPVGRTVSRKGLILCLLCLLCLSGVNGQGDSEGGKLESPSEPVDLPYNVQVVVRTFVVVIIFAGIAGRINHRPLVPAPPVPAPAVLAPPVPAPVVPAPPVPAPPVPAPVVPAPPVPAPAIPAPPVPAPGVPAPGVPAPPVPAPAFQNGAATAPLVPFLAAAA